MKRRLFTVLSGLSLLLCVPACVMWVRSYSTEDFLFLHSDRTQFQLVSSLGRLQFYPTGLVRWGLAAITPYEAGWHHHAQPVGPHPKYSWWQSWGFHYLTEYRARAVQWPYWSVVLVLLWLPAVSVVRWMRSRRRRRLGACPGCGYDLRATPERCPECGDVRTSGREVRPSEPG